MGKLITTAPKCYGWHTRNPAMRRARKISAGFISVGAVGQRLLNIVLSLMVLRWWFLREMAVVALNCIDGIASSVLRRWGLATRRWNSSLRSHRSWRSSYPHRFTRLDTTMFAPVGP